MILLLHVLSLLSPASTDYSCSTPSCSFNSPCPSCTTPPQDCQWSPWSWSGCSASCGRGRQVGVRYKLSPARNGGRQCDNEVTRATRECEVQQPCPVDCLWGDWSGWACSGQGLSGCGEGRQYRTRARAVMAAHGGADCEGRTSQVGAKVASGNYIIMMICDPVHQWMLSCGL